MFASKPILMSYTGFKTIVEELNIGMVVESGNITKLVQAMIKFSKFTDDELLVMGQKGNQYLLNNLSWEIIVNTNLKIFCK